MNTYNNIKKKSKVFIACLLLNTWIFTVLFLIIALLVALIVWWHAFYKPVPSLSVVNKIESSKEDFEKMSIQTQKAITLLKEKKANYENIPELSSQRELFLRIDSDLLKEGLFFDNLNKNEENERIDSLNKPLIDSVQ